MSRSSLVVSKALTLTILALLSACSEFSSEKAIFIKPESLSGKQINATGYLIFGPENKNLYPTRDWRGDLLGKACLPIGVVNSNDELTRQLTALNKKKVIVYGTIVRLINDGELNDSLCKDWGLFVDSVRIAN
jgi:hypothetical protein